jgi:hypothetical protein
MASPTASRSASGYFTVLQYLGYLLKSTSATAARKFSVKALWSKDAAEARLRRGWLHAVESNLAEQRLATVGVCLLYTAGAFVQ